MRKLCCNLIVNKMYLRMSFSISKKEPLGSGYIIVEITRPLLFCLFETLSNEINNSLRERE